MGATLRDVAKLAAVSIATASRVLNGEGNYSVSNATQTRVWEAARQLNYQSNDALQRLQRRSDQNSYSIGLLMSGVSAKFSDPFWSVVIDGINTELTRHQYHLRFAFLFEDLREKHLRRIIDPLFIDGLIIIGDEACLAAMHDNPIRQDHMLVIASDPPRPDGVLPIDVVTMEKERGVHAMVSHLVSLGHRRLVFVGPDRSLDERARAFEHALAAYELPCSSSSFIKTPWHSEGAYPILCELFQEHAIEADALVCGCDTIAIGAMRAAKENSLRIPDDLAITGFDDIAFARDLEPPLTTVSVPQRLMGELAARRIIERATTPDLPSIIQTVPTSLVIRSSCGSHLQKHISVIG